MEIGRASKGKGTVLFDNDGYVAKCENSMTMYLRHEKSADVFLH